MRNPTNDDNLAVLPHAGMIRAAPLESLPELLREFGVDPKPLLLEQDITDERIFHDPEAIIRFATAGQLLKTAADQTACPYFGLLLGQRGGDVSLGPLGFLVRSAPNVMTALSELVTNLDLHDRGATSFLWVRGDEAILGYEVYVSGVDGTDIISDCAMAIAWNIMRTLCGPAWLPSEVRLRRGHPVDVEPYRRHFQAPLKFNAEHSGLVFPSRWLGQSVQHPDAFFRQDFLERIQKMRHFSTQSFLEQTQRALALLLGQQRCTREHLAAYFSIHPRTLNRRLKEAGTSFRELHGKACHEMARQLLRDTKRTIPSIAALLGYSDATTFNRAFSTWEGISPAKWRKLT
jgi:AraC-like DNA-binding protein